MISSIFITNKVIIYYQKTMFIKTRIQNAYNFLEKKVIKSYNKDFF